MKEYLSLHSHQPSPVVQFHCWLNSEFLAKPYVFRRGRNPRNQQVAMSSPGVRFACSHPGLPEGDSELHFIIGSLRTPRASSESGDGGDSERPERRRSGVTEARGKGGTLGCAESESQGLGFCWHWLERRPLDRVRCLPTMDRGGRRGPD